jgi:RNA polymerase sigma factor (sigma-70 family)
MSTAAIRGMVRRLGPSNPPADADLVAAFAKERDPDAFAALVERHGPTVLGVCQRVLGNSHDAEDAFQAVFLVLTRKVGAVRPPGAVGGWLYGVAVRTANKARVASARRRRREMIAATNSASREIQEEPRDQAELRSALDEEIGKLPEALRAVVVLCDLHGKTRAEAAGELGCPEGTVAARLHRARKKLGEALARRGLSLPAAGLATMLAPATLSASAARSAIAASLGSASPAVLALAREVTRSMASSTHMIAMGVVTLLAGGLLAAGTLGPSDPSPEPPATPPTLEVNVNQKAGEPALGWRESKVIDQNGWLAGSVAYSGDGKVLFVGGTSGSGHVRAFTTDGYKLLWEYKVEGQFPNLALSPDGKTLAVTMKDGVQFLDAETGKAGVKLEESLSDPIAVGFFPDVAVQAGGESFTSRKVIFGNARGYFVKSWLAWPQVGTIKTSTVAEGAKPADDHAVPLAVSPDGKRVVVTGPIDRDTGKNVLWAWSAGSGEANKLLAGHKSVVTCAAWSKDGKTILTGDVEGIVIAWDGETFKEKSRRRFGPRIAAVAVSPDGKTLAAAVASLMPAPNKTEAYTEMVFVWHPADPPDGEPQGKIIRRQPEGIVEINIGSDNGVKPGRTFIVLPADYPEKGRELPLRKAREVKPVAPKAMIEVTEVIGRNLSRARITKETDSIRAGVATGDVIYADDALPPGTKPLFRNDAGGPFKGVASLAFAPDGKSLAVAFANFSHLSRLGELVGKVRIFTLGAERKP